MGLMLLCANDVRVIGLDVTPKMNLLFWLLLCSAAGRVNISYNLLLCFFICVLFACSFPQGPSFHVASFTSALSPGVSVE